MLQELLRTPSFIFLCFLILALFSNEVFGQGGALDDTGEVVSDLGGTLGGRK